MKTSSMTEGENSSPFVMVDMPDVSSADLDISEEDFAWLIDIANGETSPACDQAAAGAQALLSSGGSDASDCTRVSGTIPPASSIFLNGDGAMMWTSSPDLDQTYSSAPPHPLSASIHVK